MFNKFVSKIKPLSDNVEKYYTAMQATHDSMAHSLFKPDP
jgi:hypothetical protein